MSELPFKNLTDIQDNYDLFLFDMWGVMIEGGETYEGVVEAINALAENKKVLFLTNAPRPNNIIADNLVRWGMKNITHERVFTSGDIARSIIKEKFLDENIIPKIMHLGQDRNDQILHNINYIPVDNANNADILLLSLYKDEHENIHEYDKLLQEATQNKNLLTICANPDTIVPNKGVQRYCAGYFAEIVEKAGGEVTYTGKPKREIYDKILALYPDVPKNRILMIGDTFDTDILGAKTVGIHAALVLTGNSQKIHGNFSTQNAKLKALYEHSVQNKIPVDFVMSITDSPLIRTNHSDSDL
jgi:HAD superfamily hydrolase (TIGR01459 family)